jgi:hypothetical protein
MHPLGLDLRRGFFRLWIALSALWVAVVVVIAVINWKTPNSYRYSILHDRLAESTSLEAWRFPEKVMIDWHPPGAQALNLR